MLNLILLFGFSLFVVVKSAEFATRRSSELARALHLSTYTIGFIVVAAISVLPEAAVAISSALQGTPSLGLGTVFGANLIDLTIVFALITLVSRRTLKVESKILKNAFLYVGTIAFPIIFGLNGNYTRVEGIALVVLGVLFYFVVLRGVRHRDLEDVAKRFPFKSLILLSVTMVALLIGSHFTAYFGIALADIVGISPIFIGMFFISAGTVLPELFFSLRAVRHNHDNLALGNLLGTVITNATIIVGVIAAINPFSFNPRIIYISGVFMFLATALLFYLMKSGRALTRREAVILLIFYAAFVSAELSVAF